MDRPKTPIRQSVVDCAERGAAAVSAQETTAIVPRLSARITGPLSYPDHPLTDPTQNSQPAAEVSPCFLVFCHQSFFGYVVKILEISRFVPIIVLGIRASYAMIEDTTQCSIEYDLDQGADRQPVITQADISFAEAKIFFHKSRHLIEHGRILFNDSTIEVIAGRKILDHLPPS
ncbi:MAG: hypothetical protein EOP50_13110 [Sphingobacteriales bacterium]|nr:MAG: hypothetical protein EOP50_13110 [Sphingobacteriales bacterium]